MGVGKVIAGIAIGVGAVAAAPFTGGGSLLAGAGLVGSLAGAGALAVGAGLVGGIIGGAIDEFLTYLGLKGKVEGAVVEKKEEIEKMIAKALDTKNYNTVDTGLKKAMAEITDICRKNDKYEIDVAVEIGGHTIVWTVRTEDYDRDEIYTGRKMTLSV